MLKDLIVWKDYFNIKLIVIIAALLAMLIFIYIRRTRRLNRAKHDSYNSYNNPKADSVPAETDLVGRLTEQVQLAGASIELLGRMTTAGLIVYDMRGGLFSVDENGERQLGVFDDIENNTEITREEFEARIMLEDMVIYQEWFRCADINKAGVADNPYCLRIRAFDDNKFREYLFRVRPVYNSDSDLIYLVCAFLDPKDL